MRTKLIALEFQMFGGADLDHTAMISALKSFGRAAENADVALVYYAGHGLQVNGQNYLVPVDANVEFEAELDMALVPFSIVMQQLARGSRVNIALLDACRDNPFAQSLSRSMGTRAVGALGRGLSRVHSATGTFIGYATEPDNVAQDGEGRNSPFTTALLKFIDRPGLSLSDLMIEVRNDVIQATNGKQVPWDSSSLTGRFSFKIEGTATITPQPPQGPTAAQTPALPDRAALELETWKAIQNSSDAAVFKEFLERYPDGVFAQLARGRIAALSTQHETGGFPRDIDEARRWNEKAAALGNQQAQKNLSGRPSTATAQPQSPPATAQRPTATGSQPQLGMSSGTAPKPMPNAEGISVALGDPRERVRQTYPAAVETGAGDFVLSSDGIKFFFTKDKVLRQIMVEAPYKGSVDGIKIGDTAEDVVARRGQPDDITKVYGGSGYLYRVAGNILRYDIEEKSKRVTDITQILDRR